MEPLKLSFLLLDHDPLAQLSKDHEVQNDGGSQQRVLTGVVQYHGVVATHENLGGVFIHSTLAVGDIGNVLDHDLETGGYSSVYSGSDTLLGTSQKCPDYWGGLGVILL